MTKSPEETLLHFFTLWSARDAQAMVDCFAEDGIYDNVPEKKPMVGRSAIKTWLDMCFQHLTRIDVDVLHIASNGEWVLCERLDDHIVGDKHMPLPVMCTVRVVDGKIAMLRDYYCRKTVVELGMIPE